MGFTLRAALDALGPQAVVVVAELMPAVIAWASGPLAHLFTGSLDDPRVSLVEADVNRLIQSGQAQYDAILLDVDNGPKGLTRRENDRLYDGWGLKRAHYALRPGGILAVWSGGRTAGSRSGSGASASMSRNTAIPPIPAGVGTCSGSP